MMFASCSTRCGCQSPYFIFALFALLMSLLVKILTLTPSLYLCYPHPLSTVSPYSSPPYLLFPLYELKNTLKDKKRIVILGRLGLQFANETNSMLATSQKSLHSRWSFPCRLHEQDQRPALEDLPRAFNPPLGPTPGWSLGPPLE